MMMAASNNMFLWWGSGSYYCWRAMIVMAEKGLWNTCPNKLVDFNKNEQRAPKILKLNPRAQVPTFYDGKTVINESMAISMYLEDKFPKPALLSSDLSTRALCYQRMYESDAMYNNIIVPIINYKKARPDTATWDEELIKENFVIARKELNHWERNLTGKKYLAGEDFSMADAFLYPFLAYIVRHGAMLSEFPNIKGYNDHLSCRPSIKATVPPHWPSKWTGFMDGL